MNFLEASIPAGLFGVSLLIALLSRRFHRCRPFDPEDEAECLYFQCCDCGRMMPGGRLLRLRGGR